VTPWISARSQRSRKRLQATDTPVKW
jgi:hypothetical protein